MIQENELMPNPHSVEEILSTYNQDNSYETLIATLEKILGYKYIINKDLHHEVVRNSTPITIEKFKKILNNPTFNINKSFYRVEHKELITNELIKETEAERYRDTQGKANNASQCKELLSEALKTGDIIESVSLYTMLYHKFADLTLIYDEIELKNIHVNFVKTVGRDAFNKFLTKQEIDVETNTEFFKIAKEIFKLYNDFPQSHTNSPSQPYQEISGLKILFSYISQPHLLKIIDQIIDFINCSDVSNENTWVKKREEGIKSLCEEIKFIVSEVIPYFNSKEISECKNFTQLLDTKEQAVKLIKYLEVFWQNKAFFLYDIEQKLLTKIENNTYDLIRSNALVDKNPDIPKVKFSDLPYEISAMIFSYTPEVVSQFLREWVVKLETLGDTQES